MTRIYIIAAGCLIAAGCNKNHEGRNDPGNGGDTTVVIVPQDPQSEKTIGFFMDDWTAKTFVPPSYTEKTAPAEAPENITINTADIISKVPRSIAGNNANLWMTQMVTESPLVTHLSQLQPQIIRFPGGSISDVYFWNAMPGVPPVYTPSQLVKSDGTREIAGFWFGRNQESWTLSLDNYYQVLKQTHNTGMITVNYGFARYGTASDPVAAAAHLAADWVRYDNGRTRYWEVGNENFGEWEAGYRIDRAVNKDGQSEYISGELYGRHFRVFADSMRKAAAEKGATIYIGAVLYDSEPQSWQTNTIRTWNSGVCTEAGSTADYFIVHNYFTPYNQQTNAANILSSALTETGKVMNHVKSALRSAGVEDKPIALTEWNINAVGQKQQVSFVNGMHAVMVIGESIKSKYGMTSRWDLANGWSNGDDHGLFNNGDEPDGVPKWNPRPAFYYLYYFQKFFGDRMVSTSLAETNAIKAYASTFSSGQSGIVLVNTSAAVINAGITVRDRKVGARYYWYVLTGGTDNGEFSRKVYVNGESSLGVSGGPANYANLKALSARTSDGIRVNLPARSVVYIVIDKG
ncbi:alpha-L-arabinofuranosidase [Flavihumibacter solisilvae]|uniref:Alpha-L-arabinofuranosidase n=1 Tax=Flavihumibacter solisilvae TaxID=1349421 RepID=A0A0C1L6W5_9BACT|nr:alpha-L-arabinofuranosidase [Flavihumibacter solisilvae]